MTRAAVRLPDTGLPRAAILEQLDALRERDCDWDGGKAFGYIYHAGDEVNGLVEEATRRFLHTNALSPAAFPSLKHLEADVLGMAADLLHGPGAVGTVTTGGTESILLAVKSARDWGRARNVREPEMVLPASAHPAFDKAAHYFDVRAVRTPLGADLRADVGAMRGAMSERTVLLAGSAPGFPHGVIDPIEEIAALATGRDVLCHVDACLGGYLLPFVERLGYPIPRFDFRVPGVTSISADLHKYGYAAKGVSTLLYRDRDLRRHQFFVEVNWPGGIYASPGIAGARGGASLAAAWAVLHYLGAEGFLALARDAMTAARRIVDGIRAIPGLVVLGEPAMTVLAFRSDEVDVFALGEAMWRRGWVLDRQQLPPSLHMTVSPRHLGVVDAFLADLSACTEALRGRPPADGGAAAVYGMLAALPDRAAARAMVLDFLDRD
jgi:glutamate/tyrosine decarboxylase-like PLP-dependent enzyme